MFDSLIGMQNAGNLMATAAGNINNAYMAAANNLSLPDLATGGTTTVEGAFNNLLDSQTLAAAGTTDPTQSLIDLLLAKTAYTANAKAFGMASDTQQSLLDLLA
jgi:hypothetical protein